MRKPVFFSITVFFFPVPLTWKSTLVFHDLLVRDEDEIYLLFQQIPVLFLRCEKKRKDTDDLC